MPKFGALLVTQAIIDPGCVLQMDLGQWDLLVRQARAGHLLSRMALDIEHHVGLAAVPEAPRRHLESAITVARRHAKSVDVEIDAVCRALASTNVEPVFLKGAAYHAAAVWAGRGRLFSDIDILVPRERLADVESALIRAGWRGEQTDEYTQRYYRKWMHEIPPMRHMVRATSLDVHHTILPPTAGRRLDARRLFDRAVRAGRARVLASVDMVLHSAAHLFHEGEFDKGLRDLVDLQSLIMQFVATGSSGFCAELTRRARELDLERPLYYALRYCSMFFSAAVPTAALAELSGPPAVQRRLMDALFRRALSPSHASCTDGWDGLARWVLYVRGHWLRMPPHLLVYHLTRKALTPASDHDSQEAKVDNAREQK